MQHLVVETADHTRVGRRREWSRNGGGHHVSRGYGFGALDAEKLVSQARLWENVPEQLVCNIYPQAINNT